VAKSRLQHEFLDREEWESWGALLMLHHFVLHELDAELRRQHDLPVRVQEKLLQLMRALGLEYGAIDMRRTPDGEYVFFEVNPAGQFL